MQDLLDAYTKILGAEQFVDEVGYHICKNKGEMKGTGYTILQSQCDFVIKYIQENKAITFSNNHKKFLFSLNINYKYKNTEWYVGLKGCVGYGKTKEMATLMFIYELAKGHLWKNWT